MTAFSITKSYLDQNITNSLITNAEALCILTAYHRGARNGRHFQHFDFRANDVGNLVDELIQFIEANRTADDPPASEILATTGLATMIFQSSTTNTHSGKEP